MARGSASQVFTVTATLNEYAAETLICRSTAAQLDPVAKLLVSVVGLPAAAQIEIDLLKPLGDRTGATAGDWITNQFQATESGAYELLETANWLGVRLRAKSGGTGGTPSVHASWS